MIRSILFATLVSAGAIVPALADSAPRYLRAYAYSQALEKYCFADEAPLSAAVAAAAMAERAALGAAVADAEIRDAELNLRGNFAACEPARAFVRQATTDASRDLPALNAEADAISALAKRRLAAQIEVDRLEQKGRSKQWSSAYFCRDVGKMKAGTSYSEAAAKELYAFRDEAVRACAELEAATQAPRPAG